MEGGREFFSHASKYAGACINSGALAPFLSHLPHRHRLNVCTCASNTHELELQTSDGGITYRTAH